MSGGIVTRSKTTAKKSSELKPPVAPGSIIAPSCNKKADITFIFPANDIKIFAEKNILMDGSEVFREQFQASVSQKELRLTLITIHDISLLAFKQMISHLYGHKETINEINFLELLYASRKYCIDSLTYNVFVFIKTFINQSNVVQYFEPIQKYNVRIINDYIQAICVAYPLEIIEQLAITTAEHKRILKIILESPYLPCTEYLLYRGIWQALKKEFRRLRKPLIENDFRNELGSLIYLIRFPTMTIKELIACGAKPSLLTAQELVEIQLWLERNKFTDTMQNFSTIPRFAKVVLQTTNNSYISGTSTPISSNQGANAPKNALPSRAAGRTDGAMPGCKRNCCLRN